MPVRILTLPFSGEGEVFQDDPVQQFCVNKRVNRMETRFFCHSGRPYWTVAIHYDVLLPEAEVGFSKRKQEEEAGLDDAQKVLLQRLKEWRRQTAEQAGFPVYIIATNRQLADLVQQQCTTLDGLKNVKGFGGARMEKYGKGLTALVKSFYDKP
ncbi:MAG: HRDC domain-containing protein [Saprospiraceae bacterium]